MANPLLSIIVPVYNAEKYLRNSVENILNQSYKNIEVLLVNDGSSDNSGEICNELSKTDSRIKIIHQQNAGVSAARNRGIMEAKGEYITFFDSDDRIKPNTYEEVVRYLNNGNFDMIMYGMSFDYYMDNTFNYSKVFSINENIKLNKKNINKYFFYLYEHNYLTPVWNKVFKSSIIKDNGIKFDTNMSILEDFKFVIDVMEITNKVLAIKDCYYHYYNNLLISNLDKRPNIDYLSNFRILDKSIRLFSSNIGLNTKKDREKIDTMIFSYYLKGIEKLLSTKSNYKFKNMELKRYFLEEGFINSVNGAVCNGMTMNISKFLLKIKCVPCLYLFFKVRNFYRNKLKKEK